MIPKKSIIPVFVPHLGCPHMCVFCNQNRISGEQEPATPEMVKKIIDDAILKLPGDVYKTVAFYGGSFTAIPISEQDSLLNAVKPYLEKGVVNDIRLSTRPDYIDIKTLERLRQSGVKTIELGVQSMSDSVLIASGRGHSSNDAVKAAELVKSEGFELILQQMTGLPEDTAEKSIYTAKLFCSLKPDGVRIYPTVIVKDTELYDMWTAGLYKEHTVDDAVELCATLLEIYQQAEIPVIRVGLNPTDELSNGSAVGGAYHPALGELVLGRVYLKKETELINKNDTGNVVVFGVAPGNISKAVGQKRCNINYLIKNFNIKNAIFRECSVKDGEVIRIL